MFARPRLKDVVLPCMYHRVETSSNGTDLVHHRQYHRHDHHHHYHRVLRKCRLPRTGVLDWKEKAVHS